uniref:DUF834 domain-containing protein n=1 Tax=Oryza sativa subsp. japonica TaxID=39947 RepID=Q69KB2_ORYSJ|nr:hypothetical protein [Oryza sativa Japonica Group]
MVRERGGARGGGVPEAKWENGVGTGVELGGAMPAVAAARRGGGWSGEERRLELAPEGEIVAEWGGNGRRSGEASWDRGGQYWRRFLGKNGGGGGGEVWLPVPRERGLEEAGNGGDVGGFRRPWRQRQLPT